MARVTPERVLGDFERSNEYSYEGTHSRMEREGDRYFMEYTGPDGKTARHSVDYLLGVNRHQIYLHAFPDGRLQVLPTHWNVREGAWRDSREGPVTAGPKPLPVTHPGYWSNYSRTYNRACMECHSSLSRKRFDLATHTYASTFDPAIGCEACHGPGGQHAAARQDPDPAAQARDPGLFDLGGLSQREAIDLCASCHAGKKLYQEGFRVGERAEDYFVPDVWGPVGFHVDGRSSNATSYNYVEFLQSACVRRSTERLGCDGACHRPHAARATEPPTVAQSNQPCARCHVKHGTDPSPHTFHAPGSEGSRCVECHMPLADQMGMKLRDHTISVPLPELTQRFGVPNACNDCHGDDSPEWAAGHVQTWYGQSPTFQAYRARAVQRAEVLQQVFEEADEALPVEALIDWLDNMAGSIIQRASAAKFLGRAKDHGEATQALLRHLHDSEPVVRYYVVDALADHSDSETPLRSMLTDRALTVRVRAFEALHMRNPAVATEVDPVVARVAAEYRHAEDVVSGDDPRLVSALALSHFRRGDVAKAERLLRHGVALTEPVPDVRRHLIQLLLNRGRLAEVDEEVRRLEAVDPSGVDARYGRAQLLVALTRPEEALAILRRLRAEGQQPEGLARLEAVAMRQLAARSGRR